MRPGGVRGCYRDHANQIYDETYEREGVRGVKRLDNVISFRNDASAVISPALHGRRGKGRGKLFDIYGVFFGRAVYDDDEIVFDSKRTKSPARQIKTGNYEQ